MSATDIPYRSIWAHMMQTPFRQDYIDAGGVRTRYLQAGPKDAPAVIMLHGTAGTWECFCANIPRLALSFNCYAIDMVGSGFSGKPDIDYEIPVYVKHVRDFMAAVGISRASFIGVSLGAWISARLAIDHPEAVDRIVLVAASGLIMNKDTMGEIKGRRTKAVDDPSWDNIKAIFTSLIYDEHNRIPDLIAVRQASYKQSGMKQAMDHILCLQNPDIRPRNLIAEELWKTIKTPALIIAAPDDKDDFYQTAVRASKLIPNARIVEKKGVKHWVQFEDPDFFNDACESFLKS